jgi:hypothetical protein
MPQGCAQLHAQRPLAQPPRAPEAGLHALRREGSDGGDPCCLCELAARRWAKLCLQLCALPGMRERTGGCVDHVSACSVAEDTECTLTSGCLAEDSQLSS